MKVHFAGLRITKLGWTEAAHHAALEILGYKRNRAPDAVHRYGSSVARVGRRLGPDSAARREERRMADAGHPAGQSSLARLRQYQAWVQARPAWPEVLKRVMLMVCRRILFR
jgi:hypothetical protein